MGDRQAVANLNNQSIASLDQTPAPEQWILLAASNVTTSDAGNGFTRQNVENDLKTSVSIAGADASKRAYQVYCNPLHIYVPQDTVATGPLQLKDIEIITFSTNQEPAAAPSSSPHTQIQPALLQELSPQVLTDSKLNNQLRRTADAYVSDCDYGLWADANLNYLGQGYVQIDWMLDNQVIGSEQFPIGPSELRTTCISTRTPSRS